MKKKFLFIAIILMVKNDAFSQTSSDTKAIYKTGWLVYWAEQIIWVEAKLNKNIKPKEFFKDSLYENGLAISGHYKVRFFGDFAYSFIVTYRLPKNSKDPVDKDSIWIMPIKAELKEKILNFYDPEILSLYSSEKKTTVMYSFETNYRIENVEALRRKDERKISRYLKKRNWTIDDALRQQKGAF